jgi:predicted NodU family carbamoyl transferase
VAVLGLSGLFATERDDYDPATFHGFFHDAAACLVQNGRTLAAIEEERLNRDKHTNRFPGRAAVACLAAAGVSAAEVTDVAYFFDEDFTDRDLGRVAYDDPAMPLPAARDVLLSRLREALGDVTPRVTFVDHHLAHAASTFYESGFDDALVVIADGNGERAGMSVYRGGPDGLVPLRSYPRRDSIGHFYTAVTKALGYRQFDEYKVMGLASFGSPEKFAGNFSGIYELRPGGNYRLHHEKIPDLLHDAGVWPRRRTEELTGTHRDLASSAQEVTERIGLHVISYWLRGTGLRNLCLAGGVAQNTSLNGRVLACGEADRVFVPPAAHDAGAALGAAIVVDRSRAGAPRTTRYSTDAYLGRHLGDDDAIAGRLRDWAGFVEWERVDDPERVVAAELAAGAVVGWADGRSEFGPRALGARSILADPRPAANRERVNKLIKKREDYRPFAPIVRAEAADRFFDLSGAGADHSYMGFVVPVWPGAGLDAVTHVDGTARVQTLREEQNPRVYRLLGEFEELAGVPVLLNTSFNNQAEPIVDSVDDAVATFLTTGLSLLVLGGHVVTRRDGGDDALAASRIELLPFCRLVTTTDRHSEQHGVVRTATPTRVHPVSAAVARLLRGDGVIDRAGADGPDRDELIRDVSRLWDDRLVRVVPRSDEGES